MGHHNTPSKFDQYIDLASERLGGKVLYANDEFFAEKENLIKAGRGIFIPGKYTDRGKWMDGWETRRRRSPGHDWCIVRLAVSGKIKGLDIDTNHFLGNHPPFASIQAIHFEEEPAVKDFEKPDFRWTEILPKSPLNPGNHNFFDIQNESVWSHLKFNIFPDGGVARLRVYGEVYKDWSETGKDELIDLAAAKNGGKACLCNDMFFSSMNNLIMPERGKNVGEGWETKRSREPGNTDWVILKLATKGYIRKIIVDTSHFKGNYPDCCSIDGCVCDDENDLQSIDNPHSSLSHLSPWERDKWERGKQWVPILPKVKLKADFEHIFEKEIVSEKAFSHVRLKIYPDGGVNRLRLFGNIAH